MTIDLIDDAANEESIDVKLTCNTVIMAHIPSSMHPSRMILAMITRTFYLAKTKPKILRCLQHLNTMLSKNFSTPIPM